MKRSFWTDDKAAGILLVASFLILLLALVILIARGALPGFSAVLQGSLSEMAPYTATFRQVNLLWTLAWIVQLMGFGLLAWLLVQAGDGSLAIPAFSAVLAAAILGVLHGTFHMSVETWAAEEAARAGNVPQGFDLLDIWVSAFFGLAYAAQLAATAVFGWSILRTGILSPYVGWAAAAWGVLWLLAYLAGAGIPGLLFIMPAIIGVALLL
jgi:hypothetical protein